MIPIGDDSRLRRTPLVVWAIIAVNIFVFVYEVSLSGNDLRLFLQQYALVPDRLFRPTSGTPIGLRLFPLISYQFIHGGWLHIIGNLWILRIFADDVEDRFGHLRFLFFYLGAGIVAGAVHALLSPDSTVPLVGASGAIAGTLGAYLIWRPTQRVRLWLPVFVIFIPVSLPAFVYLVVWFLIQIFSAHGLIRGAESVAYDAHIAGFLFGAAVMLRDRFFSKRRRG